MTVARKLASYGTVKRLLPILAIIGLAGCDSEGQSACDEAIKATLKAPASYKRVSISGTEGSWEITYDAVNSYNAPLRAHGHCSYDENTKKALWIDIDSMRRDIDNFHP